MKQAVVEVKNVTKIIGHKTIIKGLNFTTQKGEIFGLLGPNGAGKTTTIRMIVGLISINEGDILIHGKSIKTNFQEAISHVGAIVENPEMYGFLTGYQNLQHFANMYPKLDRSRIQEVINIVGLENRIHDQVSTYSLGMRQRLGVAQAILHRPSVLILDEPTNGLDPAGIRELRLYLRSLSESEGVSVIVSSHQLAEMELMCDRIAIIQHGELLNVQDLKSAASDLKSEFIINIDTDNPIKAKAEIERNFPDILVTPEGNLLEVTTNRQTVADINACLVKANIKVYGIQPKTKTLEEKFMEVTGGGGIA